MQTALRVLALVVVIHGALFAAAAWVPGAQRSIDAFPLAEQLYFFGIVLPALALAAPFTPLLWTLRLMEAPGWLAWPRPLGLALVYATWVAVLIAASYLAGALARRQKKGRPKTP